MYDTRLEINGNQKYLVCYYSASLKNWDEIINRALERHKIKVGECPVLCLPKKSSDSYIPQPGGQLRRELISQLLNERKSAMDEEIKEAFEQIERLTIPSIGV